ncbi:hypothetical protein WGT02_16535 [Rhizobium sp. T1470]|uniref:Uncharacterized protein n=1 Tax=Rhizobium favelukesii TaxID=348824 RepID=W6RWU9_9HYPH|nr:MULTISPECIES: hypothetical protein [Rhizobium]CDM58751.1 hypothetical protein LPU83_3101 [Rhizobium favelukesii]
MDLQKRGDPVEPSFVLLHLLKRHIHSFPKRRLRHPAHLSKLPEALANLPIDFRIAALTVDTWHLLFLSRSLVL